VRPIREVTGSGHAEAVQLIHSPSVRILAIAIALWGLPVQAGAARAVVHVEGKGGPALSAEIRNALPAGMTAASAKRFDTALAQGRRGSMGRALSSDAQVGTAAERVERALSESDADLAIVVHAKPASHGQRAVQVLVVPLGGAERFFFRTTSGLESDSRAERIKRWSDLLAEALAQTARAPASGAGTSAVAAAVPANVQEPRGAAVGPTPTIPASAKAPTPIAATFEPSAARDHDSRPMRDSALPSEDTGVSPSRASSEPQRRQDWRLAANLETSYRRFEDSEPNTVGRIYRALPIPGFSLAAEAYPFAKGRVGLAAAYGRSVGLRSLTHDGRQVDTTWNRIEGSARIRFPTAARENPPWIGVFAGYAYSGFFFDGEPPQRENPSAAYHMARAGFDVRVPVDRVIASAGLEGDWLFAIAPLGAVAARGGGAGIGARIGFGYSLTRALVVHGDARYASMFFGLQREGSASVVDQYVTLGLGLEASF
jgi:hypothetical protein